MGAQAQVQARNASVRVVLPVGAKSRGSILAGIDGLDAALALYLSRWI